MKKYLAFLKLSFQEELFYRTNFFFYFLDKSLWFLVELLFWSVALFGNRAVGGYDYRGIFQYLLIIYLIRILAVTGVDFWLSNSIQTGSISKRLLQPFSMFWGMFFHQYGRKAYRLIYVSVALTGVSLIADFQINFTSIIIFSLTIINAVLLSYLIRYLLGILAFWLINITSVLWLFHNTIDFLGGGWLPVSLFPDWGGGILKALPFYLTLGFPADFFQGKIGLPLTVQLILMQLTWISLLFVLVHFFWNKGIKEYEAVGN